MGGSRSPQPVAQTATVDSRELAVILRELEEARQRDGQKWANKRAHERKNLSLACVVYHVFAVDGVVRATAGHTRDLSIGGAGLITRNQFRRGEPVVLVLTLPNGGTKRLTGNVAYSRAVGKPWFLTGIKFAPINEERLTQPQLERSVPPASSAAPPDAAGTTNRSRDKNEPTLSPRDHALKLLHENSSGWRMTAEKIAKVLDYSRSADPVVRRATIPVLMQIGGVKASAALRSLLQDANPEIQAEAADAAGQMRLTEAAEQLEELLKSKSELVALAAAEALGRLGDQRGLRLAAEYVISDRPLNRRAARAVGVIVGQDFRPTSAGVTAARQHVKRMTSN